MHRVGTTGAAASARRRTVVGIGVGVAALLALAACTSGGGPAGSGSVASGPSSSAGSPSASPSSPQPALAAQITSLPASGAKKFNPAKPYQLKVDHGTLTKVVMSNPQGKNVSGALGSDGTTWTTTEALGYSKTYTVRATARNADGRTTTKTSKVSTVTPANMTLPYINNIYGSSIDKGASYGVGMVVAVHFDEAIPHKKAAEKTLQVTTSPHVDGAWYWSDDSTAHWRPQHYYAPGTKVTVAAKVYGHDFGDGLYGESDATTNFTIGRKQVTLAQDNAPKVDKVRVYRSGKLVRTMNTSMGKHDGEQTSNGYIDFHTMKGVYTVINFENPAHMSSESYGLPADAPGGYPSEDIPWSTKISTDGVYLHELDSTIYEQDNGIDTSHGCLNLDGSNAKWFFNHSKVGDPVKITGTGGPLITIAQGGDWSVPWAKWTKGNI